jgi:ATP-dependent RNA helicase DDX3X
MSAWGTGDMAAALSNVTVEQPAIEQSPEAPAAGKVDPQAYGWVAPTKYDYETFNKTNKELEEAQAKASAESAENQAE